MRIIAGEWRGRRLESPGKGERSIRPTSDRVRESIFNLLVHRGLDFEGARGLDLFAGTGALGIEALSRGAKSILWVDDQPKAMRLIRENLKRLQILQNGRGKIVGMRVEDFLNPKVLRQWNKFFPARFAFLDPPYAFEESAGLLKKLGLLDQQMQWLEPQAWIIFEASSKDARNLKDLTLPGLGYLTSRGYGGTEVHYWRKAG